MYVIRSCFGGIVVAKVRIIELLYVICLLTRDTQSLVTVSHKAESTRKRAIFNQTAGVIFLGAPLRGTIAATFAGWKNFVFGILGASYESLSTLLDQLETNSSSLEKPVAEFFSGENLVLRRLHPCTFQSRLCCTLRCSISTVAPIVRAQLRESSTLAL